MSDSNSDLSKISDTPSPDSDLFKISDSDFSKIFDSIT